jgi:nucleotide-binding universal stress UspA family protein
MAPQVLRSILVALDGSVYSDSAATLAIEWGTRFGASLVGVGVVDEPGIRKPESVPLGAGAYKKARDEERLMDAHARVRRMLAEFLARSVAAGVKCEVLDDVGDPGLTILRETQRCDVVILGRETHFHFETQDEPDATLGQILRGSPRPVVVAPRNLPRGEGVVVAYGGGREVARTLQTFQLLGLAGGETVHLVSVQREGWEAEALAGLAGQFLAAHGTAYEVHERAITATPAEMLLDEVRRLNPRLLVMGAQGHHPVRDLFVTSVTRAVLRSCPVPVFIGA